MSLSGLIKTSKLFPVFAFCFSVSSAAGAGTNPAPGTVIRMGELPLTLIAPGVTGRMVWSESALVARLTLDPGAEIPRETLTSERFMFVVKGSIEQVIRGSAVTMKAVGYERMTPISGCREIEDFVHLDKGTVHSLKAGDEGAEIFEIHCPVRADYILKAGVTDAPATVPEESTAVRVFESGRVYDRYGVQFSELHPNVYSRIIPGKRVLASFLRIDPDTGFESAGRPEARLSVVLRGWMEVTVGGVKQRLEQDGVIVIPPGTACSFATGSKGCDVLDVLTPVPPDYIESMRKRLAAYHSIFPEDEEFELIADGAGEGPGLVYCEGPSWVSGKLYFSSMGYDDRWNGDIGNSAFIEMDADGTYRHLSYGEIETNGTFPLGNGNLAVCDMYGHRVVEIDTKGRVVRVLASECEGKRLDGPNDLAVDDKGGIYFTDPQILPPPHMQPGKSVIYIRPNGETVRVMPPDTLIKPNGLILSPDCSTLYVNSTPENFMLAYDVREDGTLSNGRKFGKLFLTPEILDAESINPQVDGMTVDELGNIYITSMIGLQIFNPAGNFIGIARFPLMPVNCCFGGDDGRTLFVICNNRIYKIHTKVRGAAYTLKRGQ